MLTLHIPFDLNMKRSLLLACVLLLLAGCGNSPKLPNEALGLILGNTYTDEQVLEEVDNAMFGVRWFGASQLNGFSNTLFPSKDADGSSYMLQPAIGREITYLGFTWERAHFFTDLKGKLIRFAFSQSTADELETIITHFKAQYGEPTIVSETLYDWENRKYRMSLFTGGSNAIWLEVYEN